jgi:hypothetical protein
MAIALRAAGATAAGTTSVICAAPAGTVNGDVLVAFILDHATTGSSAAPTGWTLQGGAAAASGRFQVFTTVAGGNNTAGTPWTFSGLTTRAQGTIIGYSGVDNTTPIDVTASARINASGTTGTTSITTVTNGAMIVGGFAALASGATWTVESTATAGALTEQADGANSTFCSIAIADKLLTTAGATGVSSATMSAAGANGGILVALRPAVKQKVTDTTQATASGTKVTSATVAITMVSTSNTLIMCSSTWSQSSTTNPVTVSVSGLGASWSQCARNTLQDGGVSIWLGTGATSASGNVTLTFTNTGSTGCYYAVEFLEFTGLAGTQDGAGVTWIGNANQAITLASAGELVVKVCDTANDVASFTYTSATTTVTSLNGKIDALTNVALAGAYSVALTSGSWSSGVPGGSTNNLSDIWCMAAFPAATGATPQLAFRPITVLQAINRAGNF